MFFFSLCTFYEVESSLCGRNLNGVEWHFLALPGRKVSRLPWGGDPRCSSAVPSAGSNGCVNPVTLEGARQRALCQKGVLQTDRWPDRCWELNLRHSYLEGGLRKNLWTDGKYVLCGYDPSISCSWILPIHSLWSAVEDTSLESSATLATQSHSALLAGTHLNTCCLYLAISGYIHLLVSSCFCACCYLISNLERVRNRQYASKLHSENLEWGFHHSMFPTNDNQFTDTAGYQMVIFLPGEASWLGWRDQNPGSISYTTSGARPGGLLGLEWGRLCCPKRLWSLTTSCYKTQELEGIADHSVPRVGRCCKCPRPDQHRETHWDISGSLAFQLSMTGVEYRRRRAMGCSPDWQPSLQGRVPLALLPLPQTKRTDTAGMAGGTLERWMTRLLNCPTSKRHWANRENMARANGIITIIYHNNEIIHINIPHTYFTGKMLINHD